MRQAFCDKEAGGRALPQEFGISVGGVYVIEHQEQQADEVNVTGSKKKSLTILGKRDKMDKRDKMSDEQKGKDKRERSVESEIRKIQKELASLVALGGKLTITVGTYPETITALANARVYKPFSSAKLVLSRKKVDPEFVVNKLIEAATLPGLHLFGIELMGGKIAEVAPNATAFFPRQAKFMYDIFSYWDSALYTCPVTEWVTSVFEGIYKPGRDTVYVGFPINHLPDHLQAYYGKNKSRLQAVKEQVDPLHILHFPTGIIE